MSTIPTEVPASVERRFPDGFHCGVVPGRGRVVEDGMGPQSGGGLTPLEHP
jgi:hypothetical protein